MHIIIGLYCSPKKRAMLIDLVNHQLRYEWEGRELKGWTRPFLSEAPFGLIDIRVKKEVAPLLLRDIDAMFTERPPWPKANWKSDGETSLNYLPRSIPFMLAHWGISVFRWFTPLRRIDRSPGKPASHQLTGWHYAFFIGALNDPTSPDGEEVL